MSILMYKQRHRHLKHRKTPKCNYAHIGYIAARPGVSKNEGMRHGLFGKLSPVSEVTEFQTWQEVGRLVREQSYRSINIYRGIISFAPETAAELNLSDHKAWEDYVEKHIQTLAKKNGIRAENLQWAAAHHNERSHPHCHIVFWDKNQKTPVMYVPPKVPDSIRIQLIKDTFAEKIREYIAQKDTAKAALSALTDKSVCEFEEYMKTLKPEEYRRFKEEYGKIDDEEIGTSPLDSVVGDMQLAPFIDRLFSLKEKMPKKGRLFYKLLPDEVKAEVDAFVADLKAQNEYVRHLIEDYAESKCKIAMLYDTNPDNIEEHRKKATEEADKLIANKLLGVIKAMLNKDYELRGFEYSEAQKAYCTEQAVCEILMILEQAVMALDDEYEDRQSAMSGDLSKAAKKEWYLRHKDKGMEM